MAVMKKYQGQEVGSDFTQDMKRYFISQNSNTITVKTVSSRHQNKHYALTRDFFYRVGFKDKAELDIWGKETPCLELTLNNYKGE